MPRNKNETRPNLNAVKAAWYKGAALKQTLAGPKVAGYLTFIDSFLLHSLDCILKALEDEI